MRARFSARRPRVLSSLLLLRLRHPPPPPRALTDTATDRFPSPLSPPPNSPSFWKPLCSRFPCHLFLPTPRWKLASPSPDVLRLLIRESMPQTPPLLTGIETAIRCNNFNTSEKFIPKFRSRDFQIFPRVAGREKNLRANRF